MGDAEFYLLALPCNNLTRNEPHDKLCGFYGITRHYGRLKKILSNRFLGSLFYASVLTDEMQCVRHCSSEVVNSYVI